MQLAVAEAFVLNVWPDAMKPTPAKEAARRAAEAKAKVAARAAEEAEARREAAKRQKSRAALEKKLSCALLMAAAEGATSVVWKGDLSVLPTLSERGLWVYEQGVFSESDAAERLKEWRRQSLDAVMLKWIGHPDSQIQLADRKALLKLFGGAEGFASLHVPAWEVFFEEIGDEDDLWWLRQSSLDPYEYEGLLISSFQRAWLQAVRKGEVDPEMSFKSFDDYGDVYGGDLLSQFRQEALRSIKSLNKLLAVNQKFTSHIAEDGEVSFDKLNELKFDYVNCVIEQLADDWPCLFQIDKVSESEDGREMEGAILHPSIYRCFNPGTKSSARFRTLYGVESLEIFWIPVERDWLPFDDTVDEQLLNWLVGQDGQQFCGSVFGRVEGAAQEGLTQVELVLTQVSSAWTLLGDDGLSQHGVSPKLLSLMLSGFGYKVKVSAAGKKHHLVVMW